MSLDADFLLRLVGLPEVLEQYSTLEEGLKELASLTATHLRCEACSIMLLEQVEEEKPPKLKVYASFGELPPQAHQTHQAIGEGIAGYVAETGQPLLIPDLSTSPLAFAARWPQDARRSLMAAPIWVGKKVIGVINVKHPADGRELSSQDLDTLRLFALFVGQAIQLFQLQGLLRSHFVRQAVAAQSAPGKLSPDPAQLARIVAKSFYRELTQAGFSPRDILNTATEVIALLQEQLARYRQRWQRTDQ